MESKTKKKLATAVAGVAMVGAAVSLTAGTFSYFSDTYKSPDQSVSTGTLKVGVSAESQINATNFAPGDSTSTTLTLTNTGSLDGDLRVSLKDKGGNGVLKDALQVCVDSYPCVSLAQAESYTNPPFDFGKLGSGDSRTFVITVTLPKDAGNNLQGKTAKAMVEADLSQI